MTLLEVLQWLEYSAPLVAMRGSPWFFPVIASIHLLGLALLGGAVLLVDLRLLGLGLSRQPVNELARNAHPWFVASLVLLVPTGVLLFLCFATKYYYLTAFWMKVASLAVVLPFSFSVRRRVILADDPKMSSMWHKPVAVMSLVLWTVIALAGRVIGFP